MVIRNSLINCISFLPTDFNFVIDSVSNAVMIEPTEQFLCVLVRSRGIQ